MKAARFNTRRPRQAISEGSLGRHLDIAVDPAFATHAGDPLAEEIVVAQFWKGRQRSNHIRICLKRFEGRAIVDVRQFFVTGAGRSQPTMRGVALSIEKLPDLLKAIEKAYTKALELDLIEVAS
ncbi:transcriptional coactivator p15/PC4 family protein [Bradyrhizobium japonicum]|uniref:transcriptional coactivator p15/PC4 family protein n=1 Tax=Bradyrhizobium japonicum TaxID=375 RepID=UPI001B8A2869|nr:transcriptional coactivator p15/PC4 family protein [Bradyrhizobium japonicum]MBR0974087.1 transcriptional coactivator p15/PC4 family protein [Bradyrhizobium japonicum]